jgi:hypothetical protein
MSLSGFWKIDTTLSQSQKNVLKKMGKSAIHQSIIDSANETFALFHFRRTLADGKTQLHFIQKDVKIWISNEDHSVFSSMSSLLNEAISLVKKSVSYKHTMKCNGQPQEWPDDEKEFGPCSSLSSMLTDPNDPQHVTFMIEWRLTVNDEKAVLKVQHSIDKFDHLIVIMEITDSKGETEKAIKVYKRYPFESSHEEFLKSPALAKLLPYYLPPQNI